MLDFLIEAKEIAALLVGVITLSISTATFIVKFINANKAKIAEFKKASAAKRAEMVAQFALAAVQTAEQIRSKTGDVMPPDAKLKIALTEVNQMCIDYGIEFDKDEAVKNIEKYIHLTKNVNQRDKDKPK